MNEKYPLALPQGTVLAGQYIVERVLGQGGFGITYEATDHKTGQRVAVKEFFPDTMAARTEQTTVVPFSGERGDSFAYGKTCFLQEAETLANFIGNENIVRIHSYFEENGTAYFVMDFIEGTSFDEYLKKRGGKIPFDEATQILVPVMDALSVVHGKGIVHRDVPPDNIYITKEGVVKLLDFGAARYSLGDQSRSLDVILKHGFAPKEQYTRRGRQGPFTDIYALGATFYFALTGKRPPDSVERMDEDDLVPPSSLGVQLSGAAEDAILKALSVQPGDRFQSMAEFKAALLNVQRPAPQPAMAAAGTVGQSQVVQTYFTAPADVPPAAPVTASAPAAGQAVPPAQTPVTPHSGGKTRKKFPIVPVAAAAVAVVVLLTVFALKKPGGGDKDNTPDSGAGTSEQTPPPSGADEAPGTGGTTPDTGWPMPDTGTTTPSLPTGSLKVVGNSPMNIMNQGWIVYDSNGKAYWVDHGGGSLYSEAEGRYLIEDGTYEGEITNLAYDDGKLYFLNEIPVLYDPATKKLGHVPYLEDFEEQHCLCLFLTEDYYIIGVESGKTNLGGTDLPTVTAYLVSRTDGQKFECCTAIGRNGLTISNDGYIYYVGYEDDLTAGCLGLYRLNMATLEKSSALVVVNNQNIMLVCPVALGSNVFVLYYSETNSSNFGIFTVNPDVNGSLIEWDLGSKLDTTVVKGSIGSEEREEFCVNANLRTIYLSIMDSELFSSNLYAIKYNDDGTFDAQTLSAQSFCPNIVYYTDGSYELNYMHYNKDEKSYRLNYRRYDANGNPIQN